MGPMIARRQGDQAKGFSRRCPPREARAAPGVDRPPVRRRGRAARRRGDGGRGAGRGDLRGVESHGSTRVAGYISMIRLGLLNPRPKVQVLRETQSTAMLE